MNLLQMGMRAHQGGNLEQARQYYLQYLNMAPNDANAKQLLGVVYSAFGQDSEAIQCLQDSLRINPNQPLVANNLALCYKKAGNTQAAISAFRDTIKLKKDYPDPYRHLITLLSDNKQLGEARALLDESLQLFPTQLVFRTLEAKYFQQVGDHEQGCQCYNTLLEQNPDSVEIRHSLALALRIAGKPEKALVHYQTLLKKGLTQFQVYHNTANAYSDLGQQREAIEYYRKAIALNPAFVDSHVNLNELLWELEDDEGFLLSYMEAFEKLPDNVELRFSYLRTLIRLGKYEQVRDILQKLPEPFRQSATYFELLGNAFRGLKSFDEAKEAHMRAMDYPDCSVDAMLQVSEAFLEAGSYDQAESILKRALNKEPVNQYTWGLIGAVWRCTGNPDEEILNDYDHLVRAYTIDVPEGFDSVEQFCGELESYLTQLHTTTRQPLEQTLMGGTQTRGNLFNDSHPLVQSLVGELKKCIVTYIEETGPYSHAMPVMANSKDFEFSGSWSVRLSGEGFHTPHVHPMGWLSSAFYVQLPDVVEDEELKQGWFKLGEPNLKMNTPLGVKKYIKPAVGRLVLFRSYMWHGTVPFESEQTRITVAFDVARKEG